MADFDINKNLSLIKTVGLENRMTDILGLKVEPSQRKALRPHVLEQAAHEAIMSFGNKNPPYKP
jgi:predicted nucleotidyltransferase